MKLESSSLADVQCSLRCYYVWNGDGLVDRAFKSTGTWVALCPPASLVLLQPRLVFVTWEVQLDESTSSVFCLSVEIELLGD